MTNNEKQRANPLAAKETPVNDHTLSDRVTNSSTQSVAHSRESTNFDNNLDEQVTRNENTSLDIRQTLASGSNTYLVERLKKHRHWIEKLEFLINWLGYINHPNTWKPEDHLPPALVQECFQQSPVENPTPTNAVLPKSDVYRPCQLLLYKKVSWTIIFTLITVITQTAVASHTHCHSNPSFKKQDKSFVPPEHNLTWKELLTYGTTVHLKIRLQAARPEETGQLCFRDWTILSVLAKGLHISNHLALGVYDPLSPKIPPWSKQPPTLAVTLKVSERSHPHKDPNTIPWKLPNSLYCHAPFYTFHC